MEILIPAVKISAELLQEIFRVASRCYHFQLDEIEKAKAKKYLFGRGINLLQQNNPLNYSPYPGGKFMIISKKMVFASRFIVGLMINIKN